MSESTTDTIRRQTAIIEDQAREIARLVKEVEAWKEKWLEAIAASRLTLD